jgi:hypothetical protein
MGYVVMVHVPGTPEDDALLDAVMLMNETAPSVKVVGLYYVPNKDEPTCGGCDAVKGKKNGFSRHPEFGYDTHECGKPTPFWRKGIGRRMVTALGWNLLEDEETPVIFHDPNQQYRLSRNQ